MNGIHDMGGMQGMGPIQYEKNEPVFHHRWEGRAFALNMATRGNVDAARHQIELIPPEEYLRMSYYEKWTVRLEESLIRSGLITRQELENGKPAPGSAKATPKLTAGEVPRMLRVGVLASRKIPLEQRFQVGQKVRARNINPAGHTRLPRYARGKTGVVDRHRGVYVFPDTNAHFRGENPQNIYSVRFAARELWGHQASPRDSVYLDMWDDYLEPA